MSCSQCLAMRWPGNPASGTLSLWSSLWLSGRDHPCSIPEPNQRCVLTNPWSMLVILQRTPPDSGGIDALGMSKAASLGDSAVLKTGNPPPRRCTETFPLKPLWRVFFPWLLKAPSATSTPTPGAGATCLAHCPFWPQLLSGNKMAF